MPRIELIPEKWEDSAEAKRGDGTPTIDVCCPCGNAFVEGEVCDDKEHGRCTIGSTEVEHPPYSDDCYTCQVCSDELQDFLDD